MRLPELKKRAEGNMKDIAKESADYIQDVAGRLTCLSCEAGRNELTSMSYVLSEFAEGLCVATNQIESFIRCTEEREKQKNEKKD